MSSSTPSRAQASILRPNLPLTPANLLENVSRAGISLVIDAKYTPSSGLRDQEASSVDCEIFHNQHRFVWPAQFTLDEKGNLGMRHLDRSGTEWLVPRNGSIRVSSHEGDSSGARLVGADHSGQVFMVSGWLDRNSLDRVTRAVKEAGGETRTRGDC